MTQDTLSVMESRREMKMEGNLIGMKTKWRNTKKNWVRQGGEMQGTGRAQ